MLCRFLLLSAIAAAALPASAETLKHTLPNGLTVVVREDRRAPVVMVQLWYRVGSVDEQTGKTGLSHALEHMMFKGTKAVPAGGYSQRLAALGANTNAYTSATETVYHANSAAVHLPEILKLEADRMQNLNFSDKDFDNEMKVIREERRQVVEDDPGGKLYEQLLLNGYTNPANRAAVIGHMADLHTLKAQDLRRWYRQWYRPNNAVLVVVGDVDAAQAVRTAEAAFGGIPVRKLPARQDIGEPDQLPQAVHVRAEGNTRQPMFTLAWRVPNLQQLDDTMPYALDVLANILDGHSAARFDKNLIRGKKLAVQTSVYYSMLSRRPPFWSITAMPAAKVSTGSLKTALEAEIAEIAANGVSEAELQRAQAVEEANEVYGRDSISGQARIIGSLESNGFSYADEAEIRRRLKAVTPAAVQQAARLLRDSHAVMVELHPAAGSAAAADTDSTGSTDTPASENAAAAAVSRHDAPAASEAAEAAVPPAESSTQADTAPAAETSEAA